MRKFLHSHWKVIVAILLAILLATMTVETSSATASPPLSARLRAHVAAISSQEFKVAPALHIETMLESAGYGVRRQVYEAEGSRLRNIEAAISNVAPGARPERVFIIGARHDPAARDAGATAAVLELARLLRNLQPSRGTEIRFVFLIGDDSATTPLGSLAAAYRQHSAASSFIAYAGTLESSARVRQALASFGDGANLPVHGLAAPAHVMGVTLSDHGAYGRRGDRALMITNTAFLSYPYHHASPIGQDRTDYEGMARVVDGLRRTIASLAGAVQS